MTAISLSAADLAIAAASLLIGAGLSILLSLDIFRSVAVALVRMIAQLILVGMVLRYVFAASSAPMTFAVAAVMLLAAGYEVYARQQFHFGGWLRFGLGGFPVAIATVFVMGLALSTALRQSSWLDPRHTIPLVGIILGSAMNSTGIALNALLTSVHREKRAIEARLTLGADRYLALRDLRATAARSGLIPIINQMAGAGIITLPGIMTGQILAGMDPLDAAKYQILLLMLLAGAGILGVVLSTQLFVFAVTDDRDRLRLDRLVAR